jgi:phosphoribosylglycinamide formyltransferase 1
MSNLRVGVLVSGGGTNLQAIIDASERREIPAEVSVVISNIRTAYALQRAAQHGIRATVIDHHDFPDRATFEQAVIAELESRHVELVCLAGFMRVLSPLFVREYAGRVMNIHPALLPAFKGLWGHHVHEAVIASGARFSGCTVHFVTEDVDGGPIIVQRAVPVLESDDAAALAARVLVEEHKAYPEAIARFATGKLKIAGNRVMTRSEER